MKNKKIITEVSRIQGIMGIKSIISEQGFWDDLVMLGVKAGKKGTNPSLIVKSAADEIVIGGLKVSDELSTLIKKEIKDLTNNATTLKQSVDDVLQLSKKTDPKVYENIVDSIFNSEKLYESLGNLITDADTAIKILVKEKGFSLKKAYDKVMEDVMKSVKNSNMVPNSLIPKISKEIAEQSKISVKPIGLVAKISKLLTKNLKPIKTQISFALGGNMRTIMVAYKNIFKSFKKIEIQIFDVVDEMIEYTAKNPQYGVDAMEPYFKRIKDLAVSAVRSKTVNMKKIIDGVIEDTPELVNNPTLQTEFREWAQENLGKYIMDEKIMRSETFIGKAKRLSKPYMELLNYRKFFTAKGFGDICKRTFQVVLKGTPYTPSEIAKRIGTSGVRNQLGRRAVSAALTTTIIIPTIAGILNAIVYFFGSFVWDGGGKKFFNKETDFEQSKGNMMEAALSAAKAVFPDSWLDVTIFTTYVPMVFNKTKQLLTAVPSEFYDDNVKLASDAGMAILNGEDFNIEGLEDSQEGLIKVDALQTIISGIYPNIKELTLRNIYWDSSNSRAYFKYYTSGTEWEPREVRIKDGKVFIVKVLKNGKEGTKEINTIY